MKEQIIQLFNDHREIAILISIAISIIVAIAGVIPSFFITAANIIFFGFWNGLLISYAGEVSGAMLSFILYRKGFRKMTVEKLQKYPRLQPLLNAEGKKAFLLILYLRLIPFIPSGLVSFTAAVGKVSLAIFTSATAIGKIPSLLLEGYSAYQVTAFGWQGKLILGLFALVLLYTWLKHSTKRN